MSRTTRRPASVLAAVSALTAAASLSTVAAGAPGASASDAPPPTIDCPQVKLAPVLVDDYNPQGKTVHYKPDRRGVYVPVIMVPDWAGRATHDASRTGDFSAKIDLGVAGPLPLPVLPAPSPSPTPKPGARRAPKPTPNPGVGAAPVVAPPPPDGRASLIGQIQRIPGAVVYTFDYRANAGRWVDDPGIGPALGDAIDCVSAAMGQRVILVTKGVGGLAARYATAGQTVDRTRVDKVSTVVDYGSPQAGSLMAELLDKGIGRTASEPRTLLRLILASCAAVPAANLPLDAPCSYLPYLSKLMAGLDGLALRTGSGQLRALRPFPPEVAVHAFAGEVQVQAPQLGWFGLRPFRSGNVALGDLIAQTASTTIGARSQLRAACTLQLDAFGAASQSAGLRMAEVGLPVSAVPPVWPLWYSTARPCLNGSLTRIQEFATSLTAIIKKEIRNRQPLDLSELEALPVPAMCGFPAGNLVGGTLPGLAEGQGYVTLASKVHPERSRALTVVRDITGDGVPDTVVVLQCANAEGRGSDTVAAYDNEGRMLGSVTLSDITHQVRNDVYEVLVRGGTVTMRWATTRDTDDPCCPTVDAGTNFRYDPLQDLIIPGQKINTFNETIQARQLLEAVKAGNRARALRFASPEVVDVMTDADTNYGGLGAASCYGSNYRDHTWPKEAVDQYGDWPQPDGGVHGDRFCLIELNGSPVALLGMAHNGFRAWRGVEFLIPTDSPVVDNGDGGGIVPPVFDPDPGPTDDPGGGPLFP